MLIDAHNHPNWHGHDADRTLANMGQLNGENLERRYRERGHGYFENWFAARPSCPRSAGTAISEHAAAVVHRRRVWQVLDGHAIEPPDGAPATP